MSVKVEINPAQIASRIEGRLKKVQAQLDVQVMKDSNYFCPEDTSKLQQSVILGTKIGSGCLRWQSPYAASQYYEHPYKSTQKNPNACTKWFEAAKMRFLKMWEKLTNEGYKEAGL